MNTIILFLGVALLILSLVSACRAEQLRMLGFLPEARFLLRLSMATSVLGFVLFLSVQPQVVVKPPSFDAAELY